MLYGTRSIYREIDTERDHQDEKFGGPDQDDTLDERNWSSYIVEYASSEGCGADYAFRKRMVKVAALAVAAIESHDRIEIAKRRESY